jgi:hypothetical protein
MLCSTVTYLSNVIVYGRCVVIMSVLASDPPGWLAAADGVCVPGSPYVHPCSPVSPVGSMSGGGGGTLVLGWLVGVVFPPGGDPKSLASFVGPRGGLSRGGGGFMPGGEPLLPLSSLPSSSSPGSPSRGQDPAAEVGVEVSVASMISMSSLHHKISSHSVAPRILTSCILGRSISYSW